MKYPETIKKLIEYLKKLPGVGQKSAERFAFNLLEWEDTSLKEFSSTLDQLKDKITICPNCGCFLDSNKCLICTDSTRDKQLLCIVAYPKDIFPIELTSSFHGKYHVLGGVISPLQNLGPENLSIESLRKKLLSSSIKEIIFALDSTVEGDATTLYLKKILSREGLKLSRLAFGIPVGSSLDYVDGSTLSKALSERFTY